MKHLAFTTTLLICLALNTRASGQNAGDISVCHADGQQYSIDVRIAACSGLIEKGNATNSELSAFLQSRSWAYAVKGMNENAIADIDRAVVLNPTSARPRALRAIIIEAKDPDKALLDANEALRIDPSVAAAYRVRGSVWTRKKEFKKALLDHDESIRLTPSASAYLERAVTFEEMGELDLAVLDLNASLSIAPKHLRALSRRSLIYSQQARDGLALADIEQMVRLKPDENDVLRWQGIYLYYGAKPAQALGNFKRLADSDSANMNRAIWLEIALRKTGNRGLLADRRPQYDVNTWPGPVIRALLGEISLTEVLEAAKNADPKLNSERTCGARLFMAELFSLQGDVKRAKPLYKAAHSECPKAFPEYFAATLALKSETRD